MRDESALLQAAVLGDDTARLALADLWEENGDPRSVWAREPRVFAWMLPNGRDPLPPLLTAANDQDSRRYEEAVSVLPLLGAVAVPSLMEYLGLGRYWAGMAMGEMRPEDVREVLPELLQMLEAAGREDVSPVVYALKAAGPAAAPAVPTLLDLLRAFVDEDDDYFVDDEEGAGAVVEVLGRIGPAARPAVPILTQIQCEVNAAEDALVAIGPTGVPDLLETVEELSPHEYVLAASPLSKLAADVLPQLRQALRHTNQQVRGVAALALAPHDPEAAMPILVESIAFRPGDGYDDERYAKAILDASAFVPPPAAELRAVLPDLVSDAARKIAECLERLEGSGGMLALLRERLADADASRRARAVATLAVLRNVPEDAVAAVLPLLNDDNADVRSSTRTMLSGVAEAGRGQLIEPALPACLRHTDEDTVVWAMEELARRPDGPGRALLRGMLRGGKQDIRNLAVELMRGPASVDIVPDLLRLANGRIISSRAVALEALGETGPLTDPVREAIRSALEAASPQVRVAGLRAVALRGGAEVGVVKLVTRLAVSDRVVVVRCAAVVAIPWCGLPIAEAAALLHARLEDRAEDVRTVAAYRLANLAEQDAAAVAFAVPSLLQALRSSSSDLSDAAAWALSRIGGAAVPGLIATVREAADGTKRQACEALLSMGEAAAPAAEALLSALATDHYNLREQAAKALALTAPPGTPTGPIRRLLSVQGGDTVEFAITALVRLGTSEAWPEVAPLIAYEGGDVGAATVWASRHLLPPEQARSLWRGWLNSPREAVQRAARYELWRIGEAEPLSAKELLDVSAVMGIRREVAEVLAERALASAEDFDALLKAAGAVMHSHHGTASMALARVGHARATEVAAALLDALGICSDVPFRRSIMTTLAALPTAAVAANMPPLRELCDGGLLGGHALALFRRVIAEGVADA
jgi:HEAT repeat protein